MEKMKTDKIICLKTEFERRITAPRRTHITTKTLHTFSDYEKDLSPVPVDKNRILSPACESHPKRILTNTKENYTRNLMNKTMLEPIAETCKVLPKIEKIKTPSHLKNTK